MKDFPGIFHALKIQRIQVLYMKVYDQEACIKIMRKRVIFSYGALFIVVIVGLLGCSKYDEKINALTSMTPQEITMFKIYPRVTYGPLGSPVNFTSSEPIVEAFFDSLTDLRSYSPAHDRAKSDHVWFLEIVTQNRTLQIGFYIPSSKGNIVTGILGEFSETGGNHDGQFQSQQLYKWYQTYSDLWLNPEESLQF